MTEQKSSIQKHLNANQFLTPDSLASTSPRVKISLITNQYIQQLKQIFSNKDQPKHSLDDLLNIFSKSENHFMIELSEKLPIDDFKFFLNSLTLYQKPQGIFIIEKGKKSQNMYILIEGQISYNIKSQIQQEQLVKIGKGYPGFLVYPQIFMTPRYVNFAIKCERNSTFLALSEQIYNKYLKKTIIRQVDMVSNFFDEVSIFHGIGALNMRKYIPYFILRCFKYNEIIYSEGEECEDIFFILRGEVQLYSKKGQNFINIVKLGYRECFGLDAVDYDFRKYNAKSIDSELKVLVLSKNALQIMKNQNKCIQQSCRSHQAEKQKLHCALIDKNIKLLNNRDEIMVKAAKTKKKKGKKNKNSLTWWGLAENVKIEQKYRMPQWPQTKVATKQIQDQKTIKIQLLTHKINTLKQRILKQQSVSQNEQNQKENSSPYKISNTYMPKIKRKIKMLEVKPKAIDMAQIIKKKLVTYARNMGSFCDRLNLQ